MNNIKDELDEISLQIETVRIHNKDQLKNIRIQLDTIEKNQQKIWLWVWGGIVILGMILTNSGMMGQLWDFNFSEFFSFQLL